LSEFLPLDGKVVIITRSPEQSNELILEIERFGGTPFLFPVISIQNLESSLAEKVKKIEIYDWLIFTSSNAVDFFFAKFAKTKKNFSLISKLKIAVVGSKTAQALEKFSLKADKIPEKFTAQDLAISFKPSELKDKKILFPCALGANEELPLKLTEKGAIVDIVRIYQTVRSKYFDLAKLKSIFANNIDVYLTFSSPSSVKYFHEIIAENKLFLPLVKIVCIGPSTAKKARDLFAQNILEANQQSTKGILEIIIEDIKKGE